MGRGRKRRVLTKRHPRDPWERMPGETDRAWAAFMAYRDAGPLRRKVDVARALKGDSTLTRAPTSWGTWSKKYDWPGRLEAYDAFLVQAARDRQDAISTAIKDMIIMRAADIAQTVIDTATREAEETTRTQLDAAKYCLQTLGVSAPKQLELSGPKGEPVQLATQLQMLVSQAKNLDDADLERTEELLLNMDIEGDD